MTWLDGLATLWKDERAGDGGVPLDFRDREPPREVDDVRAPILVALRDDGPPPFGCSSVPRPVVPAAELEDMLLKLELLLIVVYSPGMVVLPPPEYLLEEDAEIEAAAAADKNELPSSSIPLAAVGPAPAAAACTRPEAWACCMSRGDGVRVWLEVVE